MKKMDRPNRPNRPKWNDGIKKMEARLKEVLSELKDESPFKIKMEIIPPKSNSSESESDTEQLNNLRKLQEKEKKKKKKAEKRKILSACKTESDSDIEELENVKKISKKTKKFKNDFENSSEKRKFRNIEIRWVNRSQVGQEYTPVTQTKSGGEKVIPIPLDARKKEVIKICVKRYFPSDKSHLGSVNDFDFDLLNKTMDSLSETQTMEEILDFLAYKRLWLNFATTKKKVEEIILKIEWMHRYVTVNEQYLKVDELCLKRSELGDACSIDSKIEEEFFPNGWSRLGPKDRFCILGLYEDDDIITAERLISKMDKKEKLGKIEFRTLIFPEYDDSEPESRAVEHSIKPTLRIESERANVFTSLNSLLNSTSEDLFLNCSLNCTLTDNGGEKGIGEGLYKEFISLYWKDFEVRFCKGATPKLKLPEVSPSLTEEIIRSAGIILKKGLNDLNFLPLFFPLSFMEATFFDQVVEDDSLSDFLSLIDPADAESLENAHDLLKSDKNELFTLLGKFGVKSVVNEFNLDKILKRIANVFIIETTEHVRKIWGPILKKDSKVDLAKLKEFYLMREITIGNVMLKLVPRPNEHALYHLLIQFLINNEDKLIQFVEFVTGLNYLTDGDISVYFEDSEKFRASVCGDSIYLPKLFENIENPYDAFEKAFLAVLGDRTFNMV